MNLINKEFRDRVTGETFKIIDVYQNIAITDDREKIQVDRLLDPMYYTQFGVTNESSDKKFEIKMEENTVDPNTFGTKTLNLFDKLIKGIPEKDLPSEDVEVSMPRNDNFKVSNESAVIVDDFYDEESEILRKYGAMKRPDIDSHNDKFTKFLDGDGSPVGIDITPANTWVSDLPPLHDNGQGHTHDINISTTPQQDPILTMFKNVKRLVNFNIDLSIENKIPRIDFIEMMEDSYETSIIDYLASEFTNKLLQNPEEIKKMISSKIREMVYPNGEDSGDSDLEKPVKKPRAPRKTIKKASKKENVE